MRRGAAAAEGFRSAPSVCGESRGPSPAELKTVAERAVIAIQNVRLRGAGAQPGFTEALDQQMATSEILRVISQSQTDATGVRHDRQNTALQRALQHGLPVRR
jgi:hypothetical protein